MKKLFRGIVVACVATALMTTAAFAVDYPDMPDDYSTEALVAAVENGLLSGDTEGNLNPDDSLTRAQMATILTRALATENTADLSAFNDVSSDDWFYEAMAEAVYAKLFLGDGTSLTPNASITRQEVCVVLARVLSLSCESTDVLSSYVDEAEISSWAAESVAAMVEAGYMQGTDSGELNPLDNISRKDFAVLMSRIVETYITEAGTVTELADGSVLVNAAGVTLSNLTIKGNLIIGDGVDAGDVTLNNVVIEGAMIVRGGGENSIIIKGTSSVSSIFITKVDGAVRVYTADGVEVAAVYVDDGADTVILEGAFSAVYVNSDNTPVEIKDAEMDTLVVTAANSYVELQSGASVSDLAVTGTDSYVLVKKNASPETVSITEDAVNSVVVIEADGEVGHIVSDGTDVLIMNNGSVSSLSVTETSTTTYVVGSTADDVHIVVENADSLTIVAEEVYEAELAAAEAEAAALQAAAELAAATAALEAAEAIADETAISEAQAALDSATEAADSAETAVTEAQTAVETATSSASATIEAIESAVVTDTVVAPTVSDAGEITVVVPEIPETSTDVVVSGGTSSGGSTGGGTTTEDDFEDDVLDVAIKTFASAMESTTDYVESVDFNATTNVITVTFANEYSLTKISEMITALKADENFSTSLNSAIWAMVSSLQDEINKFDTIAMEGKAEFTDTIISIIDSNPSLVDSLGGKYDDGTFTEDFSRAFLEQSTESTNFASKILFHSVWELLTNESIANFATISVFTTAFESIELVVHTVSDGDITYTFVLEMGVAA